jgi:hypothetical protein
MRLISKVLRGEATPPPQLPIVFEKEYNYEEQQQIITLVLRAMKNGR